MPKDIVVKVEFNIFVQNIPDNITTKDLKEITADKLSRSIILKELEVNTIYIMDTYYDIDAIRKRDRRIK